MPAVEIIHRLSQPLVPIPTNVEPQLTLIDDIRAVLFDVYGTLLISGSGDISLAADVGRGSAAEAALAAVGIEIIGGGEAVVMELKETIHRQHAAALVAFPEVDIREVWQKVLQVLAAQEVIKLAPGGPDIERLAVEYEVRVNPVWRMPGMVECLSNICAAGLKLGIVSNAQFFTPELFPALAGQSLIQLGFDPDLCIWSYEHRQAKPGDFLYQQAHGALAERGLAPHEILFVGNDMRNDIAPAARAGFRTVLFAGDARSLRLREKDPWTSEARPDAVVTDLRQIFILLRLADLSE